MLCNINTLSISPFCTSQDVSGAGRDDVRQWSGWGEVSEVTWLIFMLLLWPALYLLISPKLGAERQT